jgi:hypothetical protein
MVTSTYEHRRNAGDLRIGNKTSEAVQGFQYLGNIIGNTNNNNKCIKDRIMMGNTAYYANRQFVNSSLISSCRYTAHWYAQWSPMAQNRGHSPWKRKEYWQHLKGKFCEKYMAQ